MDGSTNYIVLKIIIREGMNKRERLRGETVDCPSVICANSTTI
jgi:hypothetical protein